ncbi:tRNA (adenosine(37)-N6)-threonylcarbamoyltransferase complex dimerization subunit type 1 TsaB [Falsochrobactrum sp. TDYN1]|uniref:tRNA (Adenosine(37)-N6)-threonylcarbamoyltransferase complex dimerization subunit type 1 TsaB n=1 Tax=Falsochrobactrum tianjinense TaxID=2706015 RepID=A0A949PKU8_9HYPH|nr:tRNA (adenosine(37)-N6)-threonylcarbamoyltransferase complex dimerization subunit type 1 TsaB [Falsochrobactrum sp. TDYN1]MBV2142150.1 tRNA (adenosine(37)-N6)-threonylcarbamoyltransferase complex dimerization subunit type 1 TsaB [Falsochrobactrum sp. TDYN1]
MKILALDTAASWCAAAIYDSERDLVLAQVSENIGKGHAEVLMDYVGRAMTEAATAMSQIDRVAVNIGPGSFTGVRIGVSAARGFALALGRPAIGISAFEALACETAETYPAKPVLVLLDAHRGEIYAQVFSANGTAQAAPMVLSREEATGFAGGQSAETVLAGSAANAINEALAGAFTVIRGEPTGRIGTYAKLASLRETGEAPKPLYMRGPDAKPQTGFALPRRPAGE